MRILEMKMMLIFLINFILFKNIQKLKVKNPTKCIGHAYLINYYTVKQVQSRPGQYLVSQYLVKTSLKKIIYIPPLLHDDRFIMDFKEKAILLHDFFTKQNSLLNNSSEIPWILTKKTCNSFSTVEFWTCDVLRTIRHLNPNKVQVHDIISIWLLKICDESICKPLQIVFGSCLEKWRVLLRMEKSQCSSCRQKNNNKKNNKQELKNYRPISLLTVSGKIFERFLYDSMFTFFTKNSLTSQN